MLRLRAIFHRCGPHVRRLRVRAGTDLAEPAGQDHRAVRRRRRRRHSGPHHRRPSLHRLPRAVLHREPGRRRRRRRRAGGRGGRTRRLHARRLQHRVERDLAGIQSQGRLRRAARLHPHRLSRRPARGHDRASLAGRDAPTRTFVAVARAAKEPLSFISPGTGSHGFLVGEYLARQEGYKVSHIPYKGAGPALTDLLAGHVKLGTMTFSSAAEQIRAGKVLALAVSTEKRIPNFPDIPTFREVGQDLVAATWFSLSGPARLPSDIVQKTSRETLKAMQLPEVQKRLALDAIEIAPDVAGGVHEIRRGRDRAVGASGEAARRDQSAIGARNCRPRQPWELSSLAGVTQATSCAKSAPPSPRRRNCN